MYFSGHATDGGAMPAAEWLDLVVPSGCSGCGRPGGPLCRSCRAFIAAPQPALVPITEPAVPLLVAAGGYTGVLRQVILAHKSRSHPSLTSALGETLQAAVQLLCRVVRAAGGWWPPVLAIPIPPSRRWSSRRPVSELLGRSGWSTTDTIAAELLVSSKWRRPQKQLSAQQRAVNMRGSLRCRSTPAELVGARVVIIDDVVTTGASIAAAAQTLARAGFVVVGAAVLARAR